MSETSHDCEECDTSEIPFKDNCFDIAFCANLLFLLSGKVEYSIDKYVDGGAMNKTVSPALKSYESCRPTYLVVKRYM